MQVKTLAVWLLPPSVWLAWMLALGVPVWSIAVFFLLAAVLFVLPGIALLWALRSGLRSLLVIAPTAGLALTTTVYAVTRYVSLPAVFWVYVVVMGFAGAAFCFRVLRSRDGEVEHPELRTAWLYGWGVVAVLGLSVFWSGRSVDGALVYYGVMARDPVYHLALIRQLQSAVPPLNFLVAGYPMLTYHFLPDLAQALLLDAGSGSLGLHDVYYRLYLSFIYFNLGVVVHGVMARWYGRTGVILFAVVLLVGGPDFSLLPGFMQTARHIGNAREFYDRLFQPWSSWSIVSGVIPLIHRPAYYHGMLVFFAGLCALQPADAAKGKRWLLPGILWGMMAGFNFTLAALCGVSLAGLAVLRRLQNDDWLDIVSGAAVLAGASLPFTLLTLFSSAEIPGSSFPLKLAPAYIAQWRYGELLRPFISSPALVVVLSLGLLVLITFGIKLAGLKNLWRAEIAGSHDRVPAVFCAVLFAAHLLAALLFWWDTGSVENNFMIMVLQPAPWLLGIFAVEPLARWASGGRWRRVKWLLLWALALVPVLQGLVSATMGSRVVIPAEEVSALEVIEELSETPGEVVAFLPVARAVDPVLGSGGLANNFFVPALSGQPGYLSSEFYSAVQVAAYSGGEAEIARRMALLQGILSAGLTPEVADTLRRDGVRWVLLPAEVGTPVAGVSIRSFGPDRVLMDLRGTLLP